LATKYHSGVIYLGNSSFSDYICVSEQGKIISDEEFHSSEIQTEVNLDGKFLSPAFRDGHSHPLFAGRESRGLDISDCTTEDQLIQKLTEYDQANPTLSWIDAAVFDRSWNIRFDRSTLDKAIQDKPVVLHGDDHHTLWVNTTALEIAGLLNKVLPDLDSGVIDIDDEGIPNGILREWPAMSLVIDHAPKITIAEDIQALLWADQAQASAGIVESVDAWIDRGMAETYLATWKTGHLQLDYTLCFRADPATFFEDIDYFIQMRSALDITNGQISGSSIKFFADGVFGSASALVSEPYLTTGEHGQSIWPKERFTEAVNLAHSNGFQIHIHAIGDAATNLCLDILDKLENYTYPPVIAHAELTDQATLDRMVLLGAVACVQPYWAQNNGLLLTCREHLGQERLERLYAFRDMAETGVTTVFSSDWPISTYEPLKGLAVAVNRSEFEDQVIHNPDQAITVELALTNYTVNVKKMLNSKNTGTLEIGEPFDAVVLDRDLFASEKQQLKTTKVLATYKSGKRIF